MKRFFINDIAGMRRQINNKKMRLEGISLDKLHIEEIRVQPKTHKALLET